MLSLYYSKTGNCYHFTISIRKKDIIIHYHMDRSEVVGLSELSEYQSRKLEKILRLLHGVDMSRDEIKVLIWLAGWEESTVDSLLSVMNKVAKAREISGGREG